MAFEKNIKLKVTADDKSAQQNLSNIDKKVSGISSSLKNMAGLIGVGFGAAFIKTSIDNFIEQERVAAKLNQTLGYNTKALQDYASELQSITRFGDEAIISGTALLGLYVKDESLLKKLTKATLDLASAKQMDLNSAFELMTKAVSGNISMLSRYGIRIESTGDNIKDAKLALEEINRVMGGSAEAEKNTTYGRVESLKNSFGDLQENIGELIVNGLTPLLQKLTDIVAFVNSNKDAFGWILKIGSFGLTELGTGGIISDKDERWKNVPGFKQSLKDEISELKGSRNQIQNLLEYYKKTEKEIKKIKFVPKGFADQSDAIRTVEEDLERLQNRYKSYIESIREIKGGTYFKKKTKEGFIGGVNQPEKPDVGFTQEEVMRDLYEENKFFIDQIEGDLNILRGEFSNFWTSIFGEANSLLEKFLQNFAEGLFDLGSKSLISGLLSLIPGGDAIAAVISPSSPTANINNNNSNTIVLQMDNKTMATWYVSGKNQAGRLRMG